MTLGLVDVAFLGRVSVADLGGASIGRSVSFAASSVGFGIASALEPLASQAVGAHENGRAWGALLRTLRALAWVWLPTVLVAVGITYLLPALGVAANLVHPARTYLVAQAPSLFLFPAFLAIKSFLQAHHETRPALVAAVVANVVNVVVCAVLVLGDAALLRVGLPAVGLRPLGALGAGIANAVANLVLVVVVALAAYKRREADVEGAPTLRRIFSLGLPMGLQLAAEIGVFAAVGVLAGLLGEHAVSAHQIVIGLSSFTFMGAQGISSATSVRVGYAVGEGRSARRPGLLGLAVGAVYMCMTSLVFFLAPGFLVGLFTKDAEVLAVALGLMKVAMLFQVFDGVQSVAAGALRGAGDVRFPFWANVGAHWVVGAPLALVLCFRFGMGAAGLWWGLFAGLVVISVLLARRFVVVSRGLIARV
ncbi:MAG: MATE family efflux transporter [Myxococcales bacterium]|nr:MATE family efflux transporter [Myxococcales bacterium]